MLCLRSNTLSSFLKPLSSSSSSSSLTTTSYFSVLNHHNQHNTLLLPSYSFSTSPPPPPPSSTPPSSSSNASSPPPPPPPKRRSFAKYLIGGLTLVALGLHITDEIINDDLDSYRKKFRTRLPEEERQKRPRVVILGAGWGSLSMLRKLNTDQFNVTLVSPQNYFLFTPLLPSTTTGTIEVRSIVEPVRRYCRRSSAEDVQFIEAECISINPETNTVKCVDTSPIKGQVSEFDLPYDYLIVSMGAESATFNIKGVKENAIFMKEVRDATIIRDRLMDCLETASIPSQPVEEINRLLHFVVVGGGPSGVEYAAELYDFIINDVKKNFPSFSKNVKITLVEALPHILSMFDKKLIDYTETAFRNKNIEVATRSAVVEVQEKSLRIKSSQTGESQDIPYGMLVWVTGNAPRKPIVDLVTRLGTENQPNKRGLSVDDHFRVKGTSNMFALGDCTFTRYPATAQVASQEGSYLGRLFNQLSDAMNNDKQNGKLFSPDSELNRVLASQSGFNFHNKGSFAYVGDKEAVAQFNKKADDRSWTFAGTSTYVLWRSVYFSKLLSARNRFLVLTDWIKAAIFGRDISRC